jgi:hypothetical protein
MWLKTAQIVRVSAHDDGALERHVRKIQIDEEVATVLFQYSLSAWKVWPVS